MDKKTNVPWAHARCEWMIVLGSDKWWDCLAFVRLIYDCALISGEDKRGTNGVVSRRQQKILFSCKRARRQTGTFRSRAPSWSWKIRNDGFVLAFRLILLSKQKNSFSTVAFFFNWIQQKSQNTQDRLVLVTQSKMVQIWFRHRLIADIWGWKQHWSYWLFFYDPVYKEIPVFRMIWLWKKCEICETEKFSL